ncbi:hypothetical protein NQ317_009108 [Molorchus minor]|uniref:Uncharacterized protein n=1 Tax=Molorchus minor TaxID=1323400 RepID=A0ABQ9IWL5_9CUCU|nr:hypothetical protein NQ317_009108 [Molorchus minor]
MSLILRGGRASNAKQMDTHGQRIEYKPQNLYNKQTFNEENGLGGYDWLNKFLEYHPDLSVRKSKGVSLASCQGMNRIEVMSYLGFTGKKQ